MYTKYMIYVTEFCFISLEIKMFITFVSFLCVHYTTCVCVLCILFYIAHVYNNVWVCTSSTSQQCSVSNIPSRTKSKCQIESTGNARRIQYRLCQIHWAHTRTSFGAVSVCLHWSVLVCLCVRVHVCCDGIACDNLCGVRNTLTSMYYIAAYTIAHIVNSSSTHWLSCMSHISANI